MVVLEALSLNGKCPRFAVERANPDDVVFLLEMPVDCDVSRRRQLSSSENRVCEAP